VGLALLLASAAIQYGVTVPAWRAAAASQDGYRRARDARRAQAQRLAAAERRETARKRLLEAIAAAPQGPGDEVARLRRDAIAAARQAGVRGVRLEVVPGRGPLAASLRLAATGSLPEIAALAADLPGRRAVALESARLAPDAEGSLRLELAGGRPGGRP
jgi:hypothetical protein